MKTILRAVGRIAPLGVVAGRVGQALQVLAVEVGGEDVHRLGKLPAIALGPAVGRALGGRGLGAGAQVGRGEQDRLAARVKERASAAAFARADHPGRRVLLEGARKIWYPSSSGLGWWKIEGAR